jgi:Tfp pilus assembly protein PilF
MRNAICFCFLVLFGAVTASGQSASELFAAGDLAFREGRTADALRLFDQVLAVDPGHAGALTKSAMLLSWSGKSDEAIRRYERVLAADPRNATARLERAKVLSWSRQYAKALAAFREIIAREPGNPEAQLGIARILSWTGRQKEARAEYQRILEREPTNVDALVGVAQTFAWSGDQPSARWWYGRALQADPARREAEMGLAYADLADGDIRAASQRTTQLSARFPEDKEVGELRTAVKRASTPAFRTVVEHSEDTARNELSLVGVEAGFVLPHRSDLTVGYAQQEVADALGRDGRIEAGSLSLLWRPTSRQRILFRPAAERVTRTDGRSTTEAAGHFTWAFGLGTRLEGAADYDRQTFRATTSSLDNGIVVDAYSFSLTARPHPRWRLTGYASKWRLSDSNERDALDGSLAFTWPVSAARIETAYSIRTFDFAETLNHGYFDPQDSIAQSLVLQVSKDMRTVYVSGLVENGRQSFRWNGVRSPSERFLTWAGMIGVRLSPMVAIEITGSKSDAAVTNPTGYESEQYSARLRIQGR